MNIIGINHINIVVTEAQLPIAISFYEQVLGLSQGFRTVSKRNGAWLYCGDQAIVHLSVVPEQPASTVTSHFNHIALTCSGLESSLAQLKKHAVDFTMEYRTPPGMTQLFFYDPVGIRIELNFAGEKLD